MKDKLVMSKTNGECAIAIPLFRLIQDDALDKIENYVIAFNDTKPFAYCIDCGEHGIQLMNADFVENNLEFLGDL